MPNPSPKAPFSEKYQILSELGCGSTGVTYRAIEPSTGRLLVIKHIPIPASETQVQALIFSGAASDETEVQQYYERSVNDLANELRQGAKFAGTSYYMPFHDCQIDTRKDAVGYDLYLVADFCQTLPTFLEHHEITVLDALNLGLDLCSSLQGLLDAGLLHHNVKPENIYRTQTGTFLLGDLGLTKTSELAYASLPDSRFGPYSAPEYTDLLAPLNVTSCVYSLGMILYRIFNGSHVPFVDEETTLAAADAMRIEGKELPAPMYADYELSSIILKACAFKPEDRYQSPAEFMQELTLYMKRNEISNEPIVPPIVSDPEEVLTAEQSSEDDGLINFASIEDLDETFIEHFSPIAAEATEVDDPYYISEEELRQYDAETGETAETAPRHTTPGTQKKKTKVWPWVVVPLLICLCVGAWLLLRGSTVTVSTMGTTEKTAESISVYIDCDATDEALEVICTDTYGNRFSLPYSGPNYTFSGLTAGTNYTIELVATDRTKFKGTTSIQAATESITKVISFTAGDITGTSAELSFVTNGLDPDSWLVCYEASNGDSGMFACSSHNLSLQDLTPNTTYTFTLTNDSGIQTEGELSCTFTTIAEAELLNFSAIQVTMESIQISWSYEGATDFWTVTCSGSDGYTGTIETTDNFAEFSGLTAGAEYTFTIDCTGLKTTSLSTCTVSTPSGSITALNAEATDNTTVELSWEYEGEPTGEDWMVIYSVVSSEPINAVATTSEQTITLTGLIPNTAYTFEITTVSGAKLQGQSTAELTTPEPATYSAHGLDSVFVGLFPEPASANWTYRDLTGGRSEFLTSESIAFAVQAINGVRASSDEMEVLYVIRNADGDPIDYYTNTYQWNDMWSNDLHVGSLARTPQAVGTYRLDIYFNGDILRSKEFRIVESLSAA